MKQLILRILRFADAFKNSTVIMQCVLFNLNKSLYYCDSNQSVSVNTDYLHNLKIK